MNSFISSPVSLLCLYRCIAHITHSFQFHHCPQRNVGILEKIVQSLTTPRPSNTNPRNNNNAAAELEMQYKAQVDVIGQLEEKLLRQLQQQKSAAVDKTKTTLIKLSRDFERVQARAVQFQGTVSRWHKQQAASAASAAAVAQDADSSGAAASAAAASQQDYYEQMQLQLEEDVSISIIVVVSVCVSSLLPLSVIRFAHQVFLTRSLCTCTEHFLHIFCYYRYRDSMKKS
jgi:hypothetical protein